MAAVATGLMQKQSFLRNNNPKAPLFGKANILANATALLAVFTSLGVREALACSDRPGDVRSCTPWISTMHATTLRRSPAWDEIR